MHNILKGYWCLFQYNVNIIKYRRHNSTFHFHWWSTYGHWNIWSIVKMWSSAYQRILRRRSCRATSVSERSETNDRVLFEILLCIDIIYWFSPLCGVSSAGFCSQSIGFHRRRCASLPHSAVRSCNAQWPAVHHSYRFTLRALHLYNNTQLVHEISV